MPNITLKLANKQTNKQTNNKQKERIHQPRMSDDPVVFLVPASAPRLVYQRPWYVLSCLWDGAYKRTLAVNRKE